MNRDLDLSIDPDLPVAQIDGPLDLPAAQELLVALEVGVLEGNLPAACPGSTQVANSPKCTNIGEKVIGGGVNCSDGAVTASWPTSTGWGGACTSPAAKMSITAICATGGPDPVPKKASLAALFVLAPCKTGQTAPQFWQCS